MPYCMTVDEACAAADLGCEVYMCWRAVSSQGVVSAVREYECQIARECSTRHDSGRLMRGIDHTGKSLAQLSRVTDPNSSPTGVSLKPSMGSQPSIYVDR